MSTLFVIDRQPRILVLRRLPLLLILAALWFSCKKDAVEPPEETIPGAPDTAAVVAFLDPVQRVLFADPQYIEQALTLLRAQPASQDGFYQIQGRNPAGEPRIINFQVEPAPLPQPELRAASSAATSAELIKAFEEKGTKYEVWRGRKCGAVKKGYDTGCIDGVPNNNFSWRSIRYDYSECEPGNGLCTQEWAIVGQTIDYKSDECKVISKITPIEAWQCY
ncbi:MAG: hypothetical protein IPH12_13755 [Saprospirales bacterium]|nr:hypothetical protein [Saprospirales bacterium]MBK8922800.1 hypothetical protein [Saprospirales bacterium]